MTGTTFKWLYAEVTKEKKFAYIDSFDLVATEDRPTTYTTWIALHGVGFNSSESPLKHLPLQPSLRRPPLITMRPPTHRDLAPPPPLSPRNVRLLAYNQRSYEGSPPAYSPGEGKEDDTTVQYEKDLVEFSEWSIKSLGLPKQEDAQSEDGGIVFLGWSKGSVLPLVHLATPTICPLLSTYLRSIILFEPPGSALGLPPTSDLSNALSGIQLTDQNAFASAYRNWITSSTGSSTNKEGTNSKEEEEEGEELAWEPSTVPHGFSWRTGPTAPEIALIARQVLSPHATPSSSSPTPSASSKSLIPIGLIYGTSTCEYCLDASKTIQKWWRDSPNGSRRTAVTVLEGGDHFEMVKRPRGFVEAVKGLVGELEISLQSLP